MAEEKGMTKKQEEAKQREDVRQYQLGFLKSEAIKNLYIAAQGRNTEAYGKSGKISTQDNYLNALSNADEHVSRLMTTPYLQSAMDAQKKGQDIYESEISSASHLTLLKNAEKFYQGAVAGVKVSDMLGMLGLKNIHEKNISAEDKNMFMSDFSKKNGEMFGLIANSYLGTLADTGVAQAIIESRDRNNKNLESLLSEDPDKDKEKKE